MTLPPLTSLLLAVVVLLIGTFVNDAEIAREVLTDTAHFDSHSAGSLGVLVTQALGPYALLNMNGPEHRQLKRRLLDKIYYLSPVS